MPHANRKQPDKPPSQKKRNRAEPSILWHFENMDRVNRAMQGINDIEQVMKDVLDTLLSVFECDRAWLVYPCDPDSPTWQVPMERTRPEYPGPLPIGVELPLDPIGADIYRILRSTDGPVKFGAGEDHTVPVEMAVAFQVQSFIAMAFYPKVGMPWSFGLHQCSYARVWTPGEERLFQEIGRRLSDTLTSLLAFRNLQESEEKYRTLIQKIRAAVVVHGSDTRILTSNSLAQELLGLTEDQMLGKTSIDPAWNFLFEDGTAMPPEKYPVNLVLESRKPLRNFIAGVRRPDNENDVWVLVNADPILSKEGQITQVIVTFIDITERRQAEEALRKSEQRYHGLFEDSSISIWEEDFSLLKQRLDLLRQEGVKDFAAYFNDHPELLTEYASQIKVVDINKATLKMFEARTKSELLENVVRVIKNDDFGIFREELVKIANGELDFQWEEPNQTLAGNQIYIHFRWTVVPGFEDTLSRVIISIIDITQRKQAEEALRESQWRYREVFDNVLDSLYLLEVTEDGRFRNLEINPAFEKSTGLPRTQLIGKFIEETVPEEAASIVNDKYRRCVEAGHPIEEEVELDLPTGRRYFYSTLIPARDETGRVHRIIGISRDITERKRVEDELRQNREATLQFSRQLAALQEVTNQLSKTESLENLCREAVQLARTRLRFDRVSIWFIEEHLGIMRGSFGTDERGELRDEQNAQVEFRHEGLAWLLFSHKDPMAVVEHRPLYDHLAREVGVGENAMAALWDGDEVIGVISVDNFFTRQPIREHQLEVLRLYATTLGHLITRKRSEQALRESEERYRRLVNLSPDSIAVYSQGRIVFANPATVQMAGAKDTDDLIGKPVLDFIHPDFRAIIQERMDEVQTIGQPGPFVEEKFLRLDGSTVDIELAVVPYTIQGVPYTQIVARDITERKRHELEREAMITVSTALRKAKSRTEILTVILDQLVELFDADGSLIALPNAETRDVLVEMGRGAVGEKFTGLSIPQGKGISGWVIANKKPYLNNHADIDPLFYRPDLLGGSPCVASVPLLAQEQAVGALWIVRHTDIMEQELRLLSAIADIAANAIQRVMLHEQTVQQLHHLIALHQIDLAISANFDLSVTLNVILKNVKDELEVDAASILRLDTITHTLDYAAGIGFRTRRIEQSHVKLGHGYAGRAAQEYRTISGPDLNQAPGTFSRSSLLADEEFLSHYVTPLIVKGQVKGVLEIFHRKTFETDQEWIDYFETLATQAAIAIESASLFENLQRSNLELMLAYDATIEGWSRALDLRDRETEGHTRRVTEMVLELAEKMGVSDAEKMDIRRGALLHDIGKMGVPDSILLKPGPLSESDWEVMRQHPLYAFQMLFPIQYLKHALDIPYCHHEKWDGTGYPRGLEREDIPLAARMFSVVDVFDALTSDRPYRAAWPREVVCRYLEERAGTDFDPRVVNVFLDIVKKMPPG